MERSYSAIDILGLARVVTQDIVHGRQFTASRRPRRLVVVFSCLAMAFAACSSADAVDESAVATSNSNLSLADTNSVTFGAGVVAAGNTHTCALVGNSGVQCWGDNANGRLGNDSTVGSFQRVTVSTLTSGVMSLAAGGSHTCAIVHGGAKCWGAMLLVSWAMASLATMPTVMYPPTLPGSRMEYRRSPEATSIPVRSLTVPHSAGETTTSANLAMVARRIPAAPCRFRSARYRAEYK